MEPSHALQIAVGNLAILWKKLEKLDIAEMRKAQKTPGTTELQVLVAPAVLERLRTEDEQILVDMQKRYGGKLTFKTETNRHPETFAILDAAGQVLYSAAETRNS